MGTSRNVGELVAKFEKLATAVPEATKEGVTSGAAATKTIIVATASSRGVQPSSLISRGKWSVGYDVRGKVRPTALVQVRGQFHLVESDTRAHYIAARRLGVRRGLGDRARRAGTISAFGGSARGIFGALRATTYTTRSGLQKERAGKAALVIAGNPRAYAAHPGTKGKSIFADSVKRAEKTVPPIIRTRVKLAMTATLR